MTGKLYHAPEDTAKEDGYDLSNANVHPPVPPGRNYRVEWKDASAAARRLRVRHFVVCKKSLLVDAKDDDTKDDDTCTQPDILSASHGTGGTFAREPWYLAWFKSHPEADEDLAQASPPQPVSQQASTKKRKSDGGGINEVVLEAVDEISDLGDKNRELQGIVMALQDHVGDAVGAVKQELENLKVKQQSDVDRLQKRMKNLKLHGNNREEQMGQLSVSEHISRPKSGVKFAVIEEEEEEEEEKDVAANEECGHDEEHDERLHELENLGQSCP